MAKPISLAEFRDKQMAHRHVARWEKLVSEAGPDALRPYGGRHTLTGALASVIAKILLRLAPNGYGFLTLEELEGQCCGISVSSIRRAMTISESLGFLVITQRRRGAAFRFRFVESSFEALEVRVRTDLNEASWSYKERGGS